MTEPKPDGLDEYKSHRDAATAALYRVENDLPLTNGDFDDLRFHKDDERVRDAVRRWTARNVARRLA